MTPEVVQGCGRRPEEGACCSFEKESGASSVVAEEPDSPARFFVNINPSEDPDGPPLTDYAWERSCSNSAIGITTNRESVKMSTGGLPASRGSPSLKRKTPLAGLALSM